MLRSTYIPSAARLAPLPPGWTEHTAPTGHVYFYNAETKESTYKRPVAPELATQPAPPSGPPPGFLPSQPIPNLSDPNVANAFVAQFNAPPQAAHRGGHGMGRGGFEGRPRPQPVDKPRSKVAIPGHDPWILVYTKYGRRFVYNPAKNASYWRIPERLMPAILELDQARIRSKAAGEDSANKIPEAESRDLSDKVGVPKRDDDGDDVDDSSEYEEVEVTDDEEDDNDSVDHNSKRQRTTEPADEGPVEFTEDDIVAQLQAMGKEYGLEPGEYDDGNMEDWPEGAEGVEFSEEDSRALFKDLLNDFNINPYSPWDKLIEEGRVIDDPRYTVLNTMKARKDAWEEWSREKIKELKERRSKEEKKDPRIQYMAFLQERATPKLYWPEFKRKYKKEEPMKDMALSDKDREKWYREHISRLKLPQSTLKSDLTAMLKAQPSSALSNQSLVTHLPSQILTDIRYISLDPKIRDPLIEAYIQTLGPPANGSDAGEEDETAKKAREARERREKALRERDRAAAEHKRKVERDLRMGKARLREGERELEAAMEVGKRGLQSQLADMDPGPRD